MINPRRPLLLLSLLLATCSARRGALVRDGMSSKGYYENPLLSASGDITTDPDVVAITTRCSKWSLDPIDCLDTADIEGDSSDMVKGILSKDIRSMPIHVTFRAKTLGANSKRPNWMRATATLGDPALKSKFHPHVPVRAVWTCSNVDDVASGKGKGAKKEIGANVLEDGYEDCLKRLYRNYVELEVLLPRTKGAAKFLGRGSPPPSLVYRVPIQLGHVNPMGMVSKSRATVTLYPKGRTMAAASARGPGSGAGSVPGDEAVPLGMTNVHLPLGPGLVDPGWARARKVFWKGRKVGLV